MWNKSSCYDELAFYTKNFWQLVIFLSPLKRGMKLYILIANYFYKPRDLKWAFMWKEKKYKFYFILFLNIKKIFLNT